MATHVATGRTPAASSSASPPQAAVVCEVIYDKMRLAAGHKVLIIGEVVEGCGFDSDIRERIGPMGTCRW